MTTHELANILLERSDVAVSDKLAKRLVARPNGKDSLSPCWCGCGGLTKGKFMPGHDSRFHALAKKVARGEADMPTSFVNEDAEQDFMKHFNAELPRHEARVAEAAAKKSEKEARLAAKKAEIEAKEAAQDEVEDEEVEDEVEEETEAA
jgi:hypothetical protein